MSWQVAKSFLLALASTVLLALCGAVIPLAGMLLIPLIPQPALAFGLRHGRAQATGLLLLALALVASLGGRELGLAYSFLALMVLLLFLCLGRDWSIERVVASTAAGMLAALAAALLLVFGSVSGIQQGIRAALQENLHASIEVYGTVGFSPQGLEFLKENAPQMIDMTLRILPALAFAGFVTLVLINLFLLLRRFPDRYAFFFGASQDLREWRSPEFLVWCFLASGFALFVPGAEIVKTLALNLFLGIALFYFFQGLSIIAYYFHHKRVPYFFRSLAYILIVFEQVCTVFVVALGLFDLWGDFRRLKKKDFNPGRVS
ncbi:MAG TPA: DUF2232 domain-containing protein [Candidatus Binatia bacterium]|jgi:uncharacterized protein YybS (DUF2232 family)